MYILILFDPIRALAFTPTLGTGIVQYFFISYVNSKTYEAMSNMGRALYGSKWYLLDVNLRKDFVRILMMGQNPKTFTVGWFGFSNLERFRKVNLSLRKEYVKVFL